MKDLLKEGEILCPKCEGSGGEPGDSRSPVPVCDRCWGDGKLDWIDLIMGKPKPRRKLNAVWTVEMNDDIKALYDNSLSQEIIDTFAKEIAYKVDEEIMEEIEGSMKQISISVERITLK